MREAMDAGQCRERLEQLISAETAGLSSLSALLDREYEQIRNNEIEALNAAIAERKRCIGHIHTLGEERRSLCRRWNLPADASGFERLLESCDPQGSLLSAWRECAAVAGRCRALNDRNALLVSARLKHVQARLATLVDGRREAVVYGRAGGYTTPTAGRVVTTEA